MKCQKCKTEMIFEPGTHHYTECGLDNIYLLNIEMHICTCGEEIVNIPAINDLHKVIALGLLQQKTLLGGKEIRFLRKNVGLSAKKLSEIMGVDSSTISRWENNTQGISKSHDRYFRLVYAIIKGIPQEKINHFIQEDFVDILPEQVEPKPFEIPVEDWSKTDICFPEAP